MKASPNILPFILADHWIVTVESERVLVKVHHRTRWYAVARRIGHQDRRHRCSSRADAIAIAEWMREGFREMDRMAHFRTMWAQLNEAERDDVCRRLAAQRNGERPAD
ncbi:MAG: hypothetical protein E2598_12655 [Sphingobium sp.]|nr:hypothetical protein [Sphingobium sp.]